VAAIFEGDRGSELTGHCAKVLARIEFRDKAFYFQPGAFDKYLDLLQELYSHALGGVFSPFSYGSEWCLRHRRTYLLPASWVLNKGSPLTAREEEYLVSSLAEAGLVAGSTFSLDTLARDLATREVCGLFVPRRWLHSADMFGTKINVISKQIERNEILGIDLKVFGQICYELVGKEEASRETTILRDGAVYLILAN
jgi:hypothetical protein